MLILYVLLPPSLAVWINTTFGLECNSASYFSLQFANDKEICLQARERKATVNTKDDDFVSLLTRHGGP